MAHLDIADPIYNWLVDYFSAHQHSTRFRGSMSQLLEITASIIQGSVIGPVSYVVSASDLSTVTPGNSMFKYADDTYVVIPACNALSRDAELDNVAKWAVTNNLQLNRAKSVEIIFENRRRRSQPCYPPALPDIRRVTSIKILGVTFTNHLSMSDHVRDVIARCGQTLYALKVLRTHGMSDDSLREIYKAVVLAKLMYASPAWWGFTAASDRQQIDAFVRRGVRFGLYDAGDPTPSQLAKDADDTLFTRILANEHHVLKPLLPDQRSHGYSLRPRRHNLSIAMKDDDRNFITRQLFTDIY